MKLQFAPSAQQDLEDIGDYIHLENPSAARRLIAELRIKCRRLTDMPRMGVARPELGNALRCFPFRRYIIFYSINGNELRIERILHGSRDVQAAFEE